MIIEIIGSCGIGVNWSLIVLLTCLLLINAEGIGSGMMAENNDRDVSLNDEHENKLLLEGRLGDGEGVRAVAITNRLLFPLCCSQSQLFSLSLCLSVCLCLCLYLSYYAPNY